MSIFWSKCDPVVLNKRAVNYQYVEGSDAKLVSTSFWRNKLFWKFLKVIDEIYLKIGYRIGEKKINVDHL